jgi:predicted O-methyltransferase YrrM
MLTLNQLEALAIGINNVPDDRPDWLKILLTDPDNPYHRFLFEVVRRLRPRLSWEIGSCEGAGAGHLGEGFREGQVVTVDIKAEAKNAVDALSLPNVVALLGDSLEILNKIKWKPSIDLLFIDGEHTHSRVASECAAYFPLVKPGGLILFDDIALSPEMSAVWDEIKEPKVALNNLHFSGFGAVLKPGPT